MLDAYPELRDIVRPSSLLDLGGSSRSD